MSDRSTNIVAAIFDTARLMGNATCAHFKKNERWSSLTWLQVADEIRVIAAWLKDFGIKRGDRVVICAQTSLEWTLADCAILAIGAVTVPIYTSLTPERISQILKDANPSLIFVGDDKIRGRIAEALQLINKQKIPVHDFLDARSRHLTAAWSGEIDKLICEISPSDEASYVYTSGTMGEQKGVVLTHGNIFSEISSAQKVFKFKENDIGLICLPLAHVLGRLMQFYQLAQGCQLAYTESIEKLAESYAQVRPHFVCGVPRMLEKIFEMVELKIESSHRFVKRIFFWAKAVGVEYSNSALKHGQIPILLKLKYTIANILIFKRIKKGLGGRMRIFICGGAPLNEDIARFFHAVGLLVLEGYGLTETFAAATVNYPDDYRFGTVGRPLPGVELKLAADDEVLVRGPTVFKEYKNLPSETDRAFDREGWFKTGDIGSYSREGFLKIIGRKKDIIITAGGKNIAPQMIETIMSSSPYINNFMVYGDGRKYLTALVTINKELIRGYLEREGIRFDEKYKITSHPAVYKLIKDYVEKQNSHLASFETIKKIAILENDFSIATGELTPTLKIRRAFTGKKYSDLLEGLYKD